MAHDLTEVRKAALISLSKPYREEQYVDEAMQVSTNSEMSFSKNIHNSMYFTADSFLGV